ncbi:MAG: ribosome small subunit-dependent GTPase A [Acutalibacteraceae bacterium]|nr:ribosome small subunit-dependent GTPase A [Acutalibacteraceae bacterium]
MPVVEGIIIKGIGGFYYVEADGQIYECKARGVFRKSGIKPLAGDRVRISINDNAENTINEIAERSSVLVRPPVANVDRLFIVSSVCEPKPVLLIIDRMTALAVNQGIEPIVVFTKNDLESADEYIEIYRKAGIKAFSVSCVNGDGVEDVKEELKGHISAFCGNSGVGKSSLLNAIDPELGLKTGEISDKLGRGRHTTRHSELFKVEGGYVADTPGFSSFETDETEPILKDSLPFAFKEFEKYIGQCKFTSCLHTKDKGCRIIQAVEEGDIPVSRHESYCFMMEQAKNIKEWELKKHNK